MRSPVSGVIAEAVLRDLERKGTKHIQLHFWAQCVDDTFGITRRKEKSRFLDVINGVCSEMQFTM